MRLEMTPSGADLQFPRTSELPTQSPLYWVSQKDRYLRQLLIRDIESITQRRLLVYFANRQENAQIESRDIALMNELFNAVRGEPVDIFLETNGGLTDATEALISLIKSSAPDLRVIVVNGAKSNGTLLCLASKSIVMGVTSELGPIEPAIQDIPCTILATDVVAKENYPLHMFGVYALEQSKSLAKKLLQDGMMNGKSEADIDNTVRLLSSREVYFSHGSVIDYKEAEGLGLSVEYLHPDGGLWRRLWFLFCMYDHDCRRDRYLKIFENSAVSTSIAVS